MEATRMKGEKELTLTGQLGTLCRNRQLRRLVTYAATPNDLASTRIFMPPRRYTSTCLRARYRRTALCGHYQCMALLSLLTGGAQRGSGAYRRNHPDGKHIAHRWNKGKGACSHTRRGKTLVLPVKQRRLRGNRQGYPRQDTMFYIEKIDDAIDIVLMK